MGLFANLAMRKHMKELSDLVYKGILCMDCSKIGAAENLYCKAAIFRKAIHQDIKRRYGELAAEDWDVMSTAVLGELAVYFARLSPAKVQNDCLDVSRLSASGIRKPKLQANPNDDSAIAHMMPTLDAQAMKGSQRPLAH